MKAVLCKSLGGPSELKLESVPDPVASPDQVLVAVEACALNFFDTLITRGTYQYKPDLPFSPVAKSPDTFCRLAQTLQDGARATALPPTSAGGGPARKWLCPPTGSSLYPRV